MIEKNDQGPFRHIFKVKGKKKGLKVCRELRTEQRSWLTRPEHFAALIYGKSNVNTGTEEGPLYFTLHLPGLVSLSLMEAGGVWSSFALTPPFRSIIQALLANKFKNNREKNLRF